LFLGLEQSYAARPIKYLGIEQGLSNNAVTCIAQDHFGFMWVGTYDGLNRFDGIQFKNFRNIWGNNTSLPNNFINSILPVGNQIWVGTQKGLVYYNYTDSKFHPLYRHSTKGKSPLKITSNIYQAVADKAGNIYAATESNGLLVFKANDTVGHTAAGQNYKCTAVTIDKAGQVWTIIESLGLCKYDKQTGKITSINQAVNRANCLVSDSENNIWIGSGNGLYAFHPQNNSLSRFEGKDHELSSQNIFNLTVARNGDLWIATNGAGVNIWNPKTQTLKYLLPDETKASLRSGAVTSVYEDNDRRKWITTLRGGVNVIDCESELPFQLINRNPLKKNSVVSNFIISFCEDEHNNIWIGTDGSGLNYWNVAKNSFTTYQCQPGAGHLSSNFVVSLLKDYTNQIWVATFNGGIDALDKASQSFKHYSCYNTVTNTEEKNFWKLFEDSKHRIWAGSTRGGALFIFNRSKNQFELFDHRLTNIHTLFEDHLGNIWAGNYTQLIKIDATQKQHKYYPIGQAVRAITEDHQHQLWVGTEGGGLVTFNTQNGSLKRYTQVNGLPSNSVLNVLVDDHDQLWLSTYNGLSEFNSRTNTFTNYTESDGLQSNQFNYNAALKLRSGQMLFGGIKGFNLFNPDSVARRVHSPKLRLTDFRVNNASIDNSATDGTRQPVAALKEITIPYNQATLAIDYTALEYTFPDKINYAYYLEGWDHNWNDVGKLRTAYYTRLNEGSYTFRLKATNTNGEWNSQELSIKITILPPWYRSWWAYLLYLAALSGIVYAFWLYRIRQARLKYEVDIANLRVEREKELNEKKLAFFTNVSHEFRTPLTLIINPIKDLLNQNKGNADELNVIYRNARRLLGMVDHLLLFRKTETESTKLKASKINFVTLCNDVFVCFAQQVKRKKISYTLDSKVECIDVYADREKIEIALFNLVSNAIKFTPDGGNIAITLDEDADNVFFNIADNGIGISKDVGDKLFNKFYQVKDSNYFKTGFGIGLYLVKVFIEAHHGSISYQNNPNGGTTFTLSIPKGKKHFTLEEVCENIIFDVNPVTELIDYNNREAIVQDTETINLELLLSNKLSILVIDDNEQIRSYIKKVFNQEYNVLEAWSGKQGLEIIKKYLPDMVISDIVMEEMSGLELCKAMKQDTAINHIPVILLTGDATPDIMLKSIEEGAVDFLNKPFEKDVLIAKVKSILRSRAELQNYFYKEITLKNNVRNISEEHKDFLYNCISVIERHLIDQHFDVEMLSKKMGMSYPTLFKRIKLITGQSVNNFIRFVRLRKAAELLIHTNCNVNEAAYQAGFNDIKYFREHFNKQFGVNPSEFIKKHRATFQISYKMRQPG
jgi:signal transduction histidine kinase/ligand-binding sensor domain-containing protein/FixJ family two-component response regulator